MALTAAALGARTVPAQAGRAARNEPARRSGVAGWDFNGDGYADLPVGVPGENLTGNGSSIADAGAVNVVNGSPRDGLSTTYLPEQFWHQNSSGVSDSVEAGDEFGSALTGGTSTATATTSWPWGPPERPTPGSPRPGW